jgi:hypothetical protein
LVTASNPPDFAAATAAAAESGLAVTTAPEQDADGVDGTPATPNGERAAGSWKCLSVPWQFYLPFSALLSLLLPTHRW